MCKYAISTICISRMAGMPYLNFLCIALWCQTFIPIHAPMLPPSTASNKSVASEEAFNATIKEREEADFLNQLHHACC